MPYQIQLGDLMSDLAANGGAPLIHQGLHQGSLVPSSLSMQFQLPLHLSSAVASTMPDTAGARCDCLLSAVPGLAAQPDQLAAGRTLCLRDPDVFEQQVRSAGWNPVCSGGAITDTGPSPTPSSGSPSTPHASGPMAFLSTTGGKVAVGVGLLAVIGVGVAVARRKGKR